MNKSNRRIGYRTPISELHDKFEETIKSIDIKSLQWKEIYKKVSLILDKSSKDLNEAITSQKSKESVAFQGSVIMFWNLYQVIATLGIHISEIEQRLVAVESEIAELKTRLK